MRHTCQAFEIGIASVLDFGVSHVPMMTHLHLCERSIELSAWVKMVTKPRFKIEIGAGVKLISWELAKAYMVVSPRGASLDMDLQLGIVRTVGYVAFGPDSDDEFTFVAGMKVWGGVKKNAVLGFLLWWGDVWIGPLGFDVGKFRHNGRKVWGAQGDAKILFFRPWVFVQFSPLRLDGGLSSNSYSVIRPSLGPAHANTLLPGRDYLQVDIAPSRQVAILEDVDPMYWDDPQPLKVTQPDGQLLTLTPVTTTLSGGLIRRMYVLDRPQPGLWNLHPRVGNTLHVIGTDSEPVISLQVTQLQATANGWLRAVTTISGSPSRLRGYDSPEYRQAAAALHAQAQRPLRMDTNSQLRITWNVQDQTQGTGDIWVDLYAEDSNGRRWPITFTQQFSGSCIWHPDILPSGMYTFTVATNDGHNNDVVSQIVFQYTDTVAPDPPQTTTTTQADGSILVTWDPDTLAADTAGLVLRLDGGEPYTVTLPAQQFVFGGLDPGTAHQVSVQAYDRSDHIGQPITLSVTSSYLRVNGTYTVTVTVVPDTAAAQVLRTKPGFHLTAWPIAATSRTFTWTFEADQVPYQTYLPLVHAP